MYGMLLESIQHFMKELYGEEVWDRVRYLAGVEHHVFVTHQRYSDDLFHRLADAAAKAIGQDIGWKKEDFMRFFGTCFVKFFSNYGYDKIIKVFGRHLRDFLNGIDMIHEQMRFGYPKMQSPSFHCTEETSTGLTLHYKSKRKGFKNYVIGQIQQVVREFYNMPLEIKVISANETTLHTYVAYRLTFDNHTASPLTPDLLFPPIVVEPPHKAISIANLFNIFPFSFVISANMRISMAGSSLSTTLGSDILGSTAADTFVLRRPKTEFTWENLLKLRMAFELVSKVPTIVADTTSKNIANLKEFHKQNQTKCRKKNSSSIQPNMENTKPIWNIENGDTTLKQEPINNNGKCLNSVSITEGNNEFWDTKVLSHAVKKPEKSSICSKVFDGLSHMRKCFSISLENEGESSGYNSNGHAHNNNNISSNGIKSQDVKIEITRDEPNCSNSLNKTISCSVNMPTDNTTDAPKETNTIYAAASENTADVWVKRTTSASRYQNETRKHHRSVTKERSSSAHHGIQNPFENVESNCKEFQTSKANYFENITRAKDCEQTTSKRNEKEKIWELDVSRQKTNGSLSDRSNCFVDSDDDTSSPNTSSSPSSVMTDDQGQKQLKKEPRLHLKGEMKYIKRWNKVLFICSPVIGGFNEMIRSGIYMSDLGIHDRSQEMVLSGIQPLHQLEYARDQLLERSRELEESMKKLEEERMRSNDLLYSMIPKQIAERLMNGQDAIETCQHFDHVTILFSYLDGFINLCSNLTALEVVGLVNNMFIVFDRLSEKHDVYKFETLGDAIYMAVSGAPIVKERHAEPMAAMALDMIQSMDQIKTTCLDQSLTISIGMHSGAVVAGVVGQKMPQYCLFGHTVNIASRLRTNSLSMRIHISESCNDCLAGTEFQTEFRGTILLKGIKREMRTYWLIGRTEDEEQEEETSCPKLSDVRTTIV